MKNQLFRYFWAILTLLMCTNCQKQETSSDSQQIIKIAVEHDLQSLDPRKVRDLGTVTTLHMVYEGLMRTELNGTLTPAMAEEINVSDDGKIMTFQLRHSQWSDGTPVTAYDFEHAWKSVLDPNFPAPNAYQLYPIVGAQEAKEGKGKLDDVGVHAEGPTTLTVTLKEPTPYFLELTATYFFYPVHTSLRTKNEVDTDSLPITNGPFVINEWKRRNEWKTSINPYYWDREHLCIQGAHFIILDPQVSIQLFQRKELDWIGSPISTLPTDSLKSLNDKKEFHTVASDGLYFLRINTERPPFDHVKMRQAFALALDRKNLVDHVLQGKQVPALGLIPPTLLAGPSFFNDNDLELARKLFSESLQEQSWNIKDLPPVYIQYAASERNHKIAQVAQAQWKEAFGIDVQLMPLELKTHYERLKEKNYGVAIGSWFADFRDPITFLNIFKHKDNGTNNTNWENSKYITLLEASASPKNGFERNALLKQAEAVLIQDMPMIPLFFSSYNYLKNPRVKDVYFSPLGYLDFKQAFIEVK